MCSNSSRWSGVRKRSLVSCVVIVIANSTHVSVCMSTQSSVWWGLYVSGIIGFLSSSFGGRPLNALVCVLTGIRMAWELHSNYSGRGRVAMHNENELSGWTLRPLPVSAAWVEFCCCCCCNWGLNSPSTATINARNVCSIKSSAVYEFYAHGMCESHADISNTVICTSYLACAFDERSVEPTGVRHPFVVLPRSPSQMRDIILPPLALSPYHPASYMSGTQESISPLSEGGFTEEDRQLSEELAKLYESRTAYELSELHRPITFQSFHVCASDSSDTELE